MAKSISFRRSLKLLMILAAAVVSSMVAVIIIIYLQQDRIIREAIDYLNEDFSGHVELEDSHISPFKQFPFISVDLENLEIFEDKEENSELILHVNDAYFGFDLLSIVQGKYNIHSIELDDGFFNLVQHVDGSFNILNALSPTSPQDTEEVNAESFHLDLQRIELNNIDLLKLNEANDVLVEAYISSLKSSYSTYDDNIEMDLDGELLFNLILQGDTSFLHDKHISLKTAIKLNGSSQVIEILPSELLIEKGQFLMEGSVDIKNNMNLDLHFQGQKPNFDLFLAFVPEELSPLVQRYDNGGQIYFDAKIKGQSINGFTPQIDIDFGASDAFVENTVAGKSVNDLNFRGHFSNGQSRDLSSMTLTVKDFSARPETGEFEGEITVKNFDSPDIEMKVISRFDLDFLAGFLNLNDLKDVSGAISLELNFHDIIDLSQPEKSIEKLNESYYTRLEVKDLNFRNSGLDLPVSNVNILAHMDGHEALIEQLSFKLGKSDMAITGTVSDLPAILHHTDIPVDVKMNIESRLIDLNEITSIGKDSSSIIDEQIANLTMGLSFKSSARAFTESTYLPVGEFFIDSFFAEFAQYPHKLHDFHVDILVDENDLEIVDFTGMIDQSDFHFDGTLNNYGLWFEDQPSGDTEIDFNFNSSLMQLEDLFTYAGQNYVPEDYRHEEFRKLKLHGITNLKFDKNLINTEIDIDLLEATMKVHPMRFEEFSGTVLIDSNKITVQDFGGRLGNSDFKSNVKFFMDSDSLNPHEISLDAKRLDFDQLFAYNPPPSSDTPQDHDAGFNVFALPFTNMHITMDIDELNYHRYELSDFNLRARVQSDHYVYVDTLMLKAAGGQMAMSGYFNGSNPNEIYFSPHLNVSHLDLDRLMFKFENFGQDYMVSDNLHGKLSGELTGKIHMHTDMVPSIEDSELHIDFSVINGSINDFPPFTALSEYFSNKNMSNVRFDTLKNDLYLDKGQLTIPLMGVASTLGYFELKGNQDVDLNMDYTMRIPLKVVTRAAYSKLFGKKSQVASEQVDEIQYQDESKRTRFVNINIKGTPDKYDISLDKRFNR